MNHFINSLPKTVVAIGAIALGFLFMVLNDPPRTICDAQMDLFKEAQKKFLYSKLSAEKETVALTVKEKFESCKDENSPGGCFDYFQGLRRLSVDLNNIPAECSEKAASDPVIKQWVFDSLKLMVQIAWGDRAPASLTQRQGWFDSSDVVLYCNLRQNARRIYGDQALAQWREGVLKDLPQSSSLSREIAWQKSLFSIPCDAYR